MDWTETDRVERDFVMAMLLDKLGGEVVLTFREMLNFPPVQTWKIVREDFEDLSTKISLYKGNKMGTWPDSLRNEEARNEYAAYLGTEESPFGKYNEDKDHEYDETLNLRLVTVENWISNWTPRILFLEKDVSTIMDILQHEVDLWKEHMLHQHGLTVPGVNTPESYGGVTYDCLNCNENCDDCAYANEDVPELFETGPIFPPYPYMLEEVCHEEKWVDGGCVGCQGEEEICWDDTCPDKLEPQEIQATINGVTIKFPDELTLQDWVSSNS